MKTAPADAAAVMDAAGWESAHVVGHSLGGPVGLQLALTARRRVRSLALVCGFARGREVGPLSWRLVWAGVRMQLGTRPMKRRAFLELVTPPGSTGGRDALAAELAPLFGHDLADPPPVVKDQMAAMRAFDATPRLAELAGVPVFVASAEFDPIAPPGLGRAVAAAIPGARFVALDGTSHGVILTEPGRVNALLAEHLADAGRRGAGRDGADRRLQRPPPCRGVVLKTRRPRADNTRVPCLGSPRQTFLPPGGSPPGIATAASGRWGTTAPEPG